MNRDIWARVAKIIRRIIGVPDYERYVAHVRRCHPEQPLLSRDDFSRDQLTRRYETPGNRCC